MHAAVMIASGLIGGAPTGAPTGAIAITALGARYVGVRGDLLCTVTGDVDHVNWSYDVGAGEVAIETVAAAPWTSFDFTPGSAVSTTVYARAYDAADTLLDEDSETITVGTLAAAWRACGFTEDGDEVWDPAAEYVTLNGSDVASIVGLINAYPLAQSTASRQPAWSATCWNGESPGYECDGANILQCVTAALVDHFTGTDCSVGVGCAVQLTANEVTKTVCGLYDATSSRVRGGTIETSGTSFALYRGSAAALTYTGSNLRRQHLCAVCSGATRTLYRGNLAANTGDATGGAVTMASFSVGGNLSTTSLARAIKAKFGVVYITSHPETIDWAGVESLLEARGYGLGLSGLPTLAAETVLVVSDTQEQGAPWAAVCACVRAQPTVLKALYVNGDLIRNGGDAAAQWAEFYAECDDFADATWANSSKARLWDAHGNHEVSGETYLLSQLTGEAAALESGKYYGTFDASAHVDIFSCDSEDLTTGRAAQEAWLVADLAASTKPWKLGAWHKRTYPIDNYDYGSGVHGLGVALGLVAACEAASVPLVIQGHTHASGATVAILAGVPNAAGIVYLNVGKASAPSIVYPVYAGTEGVVDAVIPRTDTFVRDTSVAAWGEITPYAAFTTLEATATTLRCRLWHVEQLLSGTHRVCCIYDHTFYS